MQQSVVLIHPHLDSPHVNKTLIILSLDITNFSQKNKIYGNNTISLSIKSLNITSPHPRQNTNHQRYNKIQTQPLAALSLLLIL